MQTPAFVGCRRRASGEQVFFLVAQAAHTPKLGQRAGDFFFHGAILSLQNHGVEMEK